MSEIKTSTENKPVTSPDNNNVNAAGTGKGAGEGKPATTSAERSENRPKAAPEGKPVNAKKPAPEGKAGGERRPAPEGKPVNAKKPASEGRPAGEGKPAGERNPSAERKSAGEGMPAPGRNPAPERRLADESKASSEDRPVSRSKPAPEGKPVNAMKPAPEGRPGGERKPASGAKPAGERKPAPERRPESALADPAKDEGKKVKSTHNNRVRNVHEMERDFSEKPPVAAKKGDKGKKKKRSKKPGALGIYFIYLAVLIILSTVVLGVLWFKLADYQKELDAKQQAQAAAPTPTPMPKDEIKEAQAAFEKYADGLTVSDWTALWMDTRTNDPEDADTVSGYFTKALAEEGTTYYLDLMYDEDSPVYKIKIGDKDAARVFMSKGMTGNWSMASVELVLKGDHEIKDELPSGMELLINGQPAAASGETVDHFPYTGIENVMTDPVVWNVYDVEGMLTEAEVSYANEDGFVWSDDDNCYLAMADDVPTEDIMQRAEGFFKAYMNYTMSGGAGWREYNREKEAAAANGTAAPGNPVWGRFAACAAYTPSDSVAYSMLQKAFDSTCYGLAYSNHDYGLMETRGPIRWAGNCVGVDFYYHAYATINGQRKDYSGGDQLFRVYFINRDGSWKIWAFTA